VVVGRGWAEGTVELRNRFSGEKRELVTGAGLATAITAAVTS
jgi:prolyl-tRNA synthetase